MLSDVILNIIQTYIIKQREKILKTSCYNFILENIWLKLNWNWLEIAFKSFRKKFVKWKINEKIKAMRYDKKINSVIMITLEAWCHAHKES